MAPHISNRVGRVSPSQTLSISVLASKVRASGKNVINLSAGQPNFDTPDHIKQAAIASINSGQTKYTPIGGTTLLKKAIAEKMRRENKLDYDAETQVFASCGAKHSLYNICQVLLGPGDEAIVPAPFWVSYPEMIRLADATPVIIAPHDSKRMKITADQLRDALTDKTRMVILNSPNNPSGAVYDKDELRALGEVLLEHPNVTVVSDDIYEHIIFGGRKFNNIINACPDLHKRTLVVNGVSKAYSMTGWRIGYTCGPMEIIDAMRKIQSHSTSNPASISQDAATEALAGSQDLVRIFNQEFEKRHTHMYELLRDINHIECIPSEGSFYIFPNFSRVIDKSSEFNNDLQLAQYLLEKVYVATVPGIAFGMPGHLRISFSIDSESIKTGIMRIRNLLDKV